MISKADMSARNKQIFEMRKNGATHSEIANKVGVSSPRVGQILSNYKKPYRKISYTDEVVENNKQTLFETAKSGEVKPVNVNYLVSAIINCDMESKAKLELLKNLL